jgi:hypothetical protein
MRIIKEQKERIEARSEEERKQQGELYEAVYKGVPT